MHTQEYNPTVSFFCDRENPVWMMFNPDTGKKEPKASKPRTYEKAQQEGKSVSHLEHRKLKEIILSLPKIKHPVKGAEGSMYFFLDDTLVYHNREDMEKRGTYNSIGICGIDLDHMPEDLAALVNEHFPTYTQKMPQLLASYTSHSKKGIHIIVRCRAGLDAKQYVTQTILQTLRLVEVIKETDGVDLTDYIDVSSTSMSQRHFTAKCDNPQWNSQSEDSYIEPPTECPLNGDSKAAQDVQKKWKSAQSRWETDADEMMRELMPELFEEQEDIYELEEITDPINPDLYVHYNRRWLVWISLWKLLKGNAKRFKEEAEKIAAQFARTNPDRDHKADFYLKEARASIKESKKAYAFPASTLAQLGYFTKHASTVKLEKEIKEVKADEEDKRRVMTAARKQWISHITPTASKIKLEGRYISDKEIQIIKKTVNENERVTLKAPTGTGKTTAIKRIANEHKAVVLAPFRVLVGEYASDLNVIEDEKEYRDTEACCMTYDRFDIMGAHHFRNKWIFIDESHILFMDRTYRDRLVSLFTKIDKLTEQGCRIVFVSATPIMTAGTKLLEFYQDRPIVRVFPVFLECKDGKHGRRAENFIKKRILDKGGLDDQYDRILIFSDTSTRRLFDSTTFLLGDDVGIMHSQYTEECQKITADKRLKAKKTMCTSIAYNGVNFINEDEYIAVISMVEDSTTAWNIIQQCGRVRNSIVDLYIVCDRGSNSERLSVDQRVKLNDLRSELGLTSKILWEDKVEAERQVEEYIKANSDIFTILNALIDEEYFHVRGQIYLKLDAEPKTNPLRRAADKYVKENLCEKLFDPAFAPKFEKDIITKYFKENMRALNYVRDGGFAVSLAELKAAMANSGTKSVQSFVAELKHIKQAVEFSDEELKSMEDKFKGMAAVYGKDDKILLKQIRSQLNEIEKLNAEYKSCKSDREILARYDAEQIARRENQAEGRSKAGKMRGKRISVTMNGETRVFDSKSEAAEWIGCTRRTLDKIISGEGRLSKKCQIDIV